MQPREIVGPSGIPLSDDNLRTLARGGSKYILCMPLRRGSEVAEHAITRPGRYGRVAENLHRLFETFELLADNPRMGRPRSASAPADVHFFPVSGTPSVIIYRTRDVLEILRVWHGRQDPARIEPEIGPEVFHQRVSDLTGGFLAPLRVVTLPLDLTARERRSCSREVAVYHPVVRHFFRCSPRASWRDFQRAAIRTDEGRTALAARRRSRKLVAFTEANRAAPARLLVEHRGQRILIFTCDNDTAYAIAWEHCIMPVTSDIGREERRQVLERFRRGDLRALVSAQVLNEGIDVPDADTAILVGGPPPSPISPRLARSTLFSCAQRARDRSGDWDRAAVLSDAAKHTGTSPDSLEQSLLADLQRERILHVPSTTASSKNASPWTSGESPPDYDLVREPDTSSALTPTRTRAFRTTSGPGAAPILASTGALRRASSRSGRSPSTRTRWWAVCAPSSSIPTSSRS